jgi:hypothetical protein
MNRSAYNRLSEGKQQREVESILSERYGVRNLLWRRNAIIQAKGTMRSQQLLLPLHVEELSWKIQRVRERVCYGHAEKSSPGQSNIRLVVEQIRVEVHA